MLINTELLVCAPSVLCRAWNIILFIIDVAYVAPHETGLDDARYRDIVLGEGCGYCCLQQTSKIDVLLLYSAFIL